MGDFEWKQIGKGITADYQGQFFSDTVDISGDGMRIVTGVEGRVRVYSNSGDDLTWQQVGNDIFDPLPQAGNSFGERNKISKDGTTVIAAAEGQTVGGEENVGVVHVFRYDGTDWNLIGTIEGLSGRTFFGCQISINQNGGFIAVGDYIDDFFTNNPLPEVVRVFINDGAAFQQHGGAITVPNNGIFELDRDFGFPIKLSDDGQRIIIADRFKTETAFVEGAAYIFEYQLSDWVEIKKYVGAYTNAQRGLWSSLSGDGKHVIVASAGGIAPNASVETFRDVGGSWQPYGSKILEDPDTDINLVADISTDGTVIAVGSRGNPYFIRIYDLIDDEWIQRGNDITTVSRNRVAGILALTADGNRFVMRKGSIYDQDVVVLEWTDKFPTSFETYTSRKYWSAILSSYC